MLVSGQRLFNRSPETRNGIFRRVERLKYSYKLRDLQYVLYPSRDGSEFDHPAGATGRSVETNERANTATVDVVHIGEIYNNLGIVSDQVPHLVAEESCFLAANYSSFAVND